MVSDKLGWNRYLRDTHNALARESFHELRQWYEKSANADDWRSG